MRGEDFPYIQVQH